MPKEIATDARPGECVYIKGCFLGIGERMSKELDRLNSIGAIKIMRKINEIIDKLNGDEIMTDMIKSGEEIMSNMFLESRTPTMNPERKVTYWADIEKFKKILETKKHKAPENVREQATNDVIDWVILQLKVVDI